MNEAEPTAEEPRSGSFERWVADLKRRKVFRVVAAYGAISLVVIEAADLVFPRVPLPDWTVSLVVWLAILGLPVAIILSWAYEVTPSGVRRTRESPGEVAALAADGGPAWRGLLLGLFGVVLLGVGFFGGARASGGLPGTPHLGDSTDREARTYHDPAEDPRPAIAVLPFSDLSPSGDQAYFSDGISEEILSALSRIRELRVAARSSASSYRPGEQDIREIGDALGVPYLLTGSVRRAGTTVRISAELVDVETGFRLWDETFTEELNDVFAIQTAIATEIAGQLRVPLGLEPAELLSATPDTEAFDLYLEGRAALRRRGRGVLEAVELFRAAVARDSTWASAWAALAEANAIAPLYAGNGGTGESTDSSFWAESLEAAEFAARKALDLDPRNASAWVALGGVHRDRWEWEQGERALLAALEADPDNGEAHVQYSELLWGMGRLEESLREARRSLALDRTPIRLDIVGFVLYQLGRPDEAVPLLEEGIALDPDEEVHFLRTVLGRLLLFTGRYDEARRYAEYFGDPEAFRMQADALEQMDPRRLPDDPHRVRPQTWQLFGDSEQALETLARNTFRMPFRVPFEIWDPVLAPLRDTREFHERILRGVNLEGASAPPPQNPIRPRR